MKQNNMPRRKILTTAINKTFLVVLPTEKLIVFKICYSEQTTVIFSSLIFTLDMSFVQVNYLET